VAAGVGAGHPDRVTEEVVLIEGLAARERRYAGVPTGTAGPGPPGNFPSLLVTLDAASDPSAPVRTVIHGDWTGLAKRFFQVSRAAPPLLAVITRGGRYTRSRKVVDVTSSTPRGTGRHKFELRLALSNNNRLSVRWRQMSRVTRLEASPVLCLVPVV
jgi:hypothetical protein